MYRFFIALGLAFALMACTDDRTDGSPGQGGAGGAVVRLAGIYGPGRTTRLLDSLRSLPEPEVVTLPEEVKQDAKLALERMLSI